MFREYLDIYRLPIKNPDQFWLQLLKTKYSQLGIDAIVGESEEAAAFVFDHGREIEPNAAQVLFTSHPIRLSSKQSAIVPRFDEIYKRTVHYALSQNPKAERAFVIDGLNDEGKVEVAKILETLENNSNLTAEVIRDFSLDELVEKIKGIPANSVIFYSLVFGDKTGKKYVPREVLEKIALVSEAPIYISYSSLIGTGAVGGHLLDARTVAFNSLETIDDYLKNRTFSENSSKASLPMFDWQALQRYSISEQKLPSGAEIINVPVRFIDRYYRQIMAGLAGLIILYIFVVGLAAYLSRKNRTLTKLNHYLTVTKTKLNAANQVLSEIATTDPLTHLLNRRAAMPIITEAIRRSSRSEDKFCLILCDIDNFKQINDRYGHHVGDQVIVHISEIMKDTTRLADTIARWGGEEFLLLVCVKDTSLAIQLANKVRKAIAAERISSELLHVTMSFGVIEIKPSHTFDEVFCAVDKALYSAKKQGKNQVCVAN